MMNNSLKTVALTLSLLMTTMLMGKDAHGFTFTEDFVKGFYWASFPLGLNKFSADPSDGPLLAQLTEESELEWEQALGFIVWGSPTGFLVTNSKEGNHIRWSDNFAAETGFDSQTTLAVTIRYSLGTHYNKVEIVLNGNNPALRANSNNLLKKTILHELGHTLGLDHTSQAGIMQAFVGNISSLQPDDIAGGQAVLAEHLNRQAIGFISPFAFIEEEGSGGCGSVEFKGNGSGGSGASFFLSLMLGLMMMAAIPRRRAAIRI